MKLSTEIFFVLASLGAVGLTFLIEWLRARPIDSSLHDPSGWLLSHLVIVAVVIVIGSLLLLLAGILY
jgi:hypothetical protein